MAQQFSNLQDLHRKLWNNANNRWFQQDDNDQKRKRIAENGYKKCISSNLSMKFQLNSIIKKSFANIN